MSREPTALLLAAFLVTFVLTRAYTRLARVRGWGSASANGVHVHHMAVGMGKPHSLWSRRFYRGHKLERARRRYESPGSWLVRWHERIDDLIGGAPSTHAMFAPAMELLTGRRGPAARQSAEGS